MSEFINTIEVLGDEATMDAIIERTITEFKDDMLTSLGKSAFADCLALTTVDCPKVINFADRVFQNCVALVDANFESLTNPGSYTFYGCKALTNVNLGSVTRLGAQTFYNCSQLRVLDLPKLSTIPVGSNEAFYHCTSLSALILRNESVVSIDTTEHFNNSSIASGTGYIYVPRDLIEDYKVATNWSTYADQFRALEDYTVDGTTTGELDETKI